MFPCLQHLLSSFWYVEPVRVLPAVPDKDLRVGRDGFDSVEVDVEVNLTGDEILLRRVVTEVHVVHPVALARVAHIEVLVDIIVLENLPQTNPAGVISLWWFLVEQLSI